ncbi:MAG TPA: hypothetical protein VGQ81_09790 [Acidobacteriota bacterium]|nr:hypothetical protein [Acidobacteriota bacterium]
MDRFRIADFGLRIADLKMSVVSSPWSVAQAQNLKQTANEANPKSSIRNPQS